MASKIKKLLKKVGKAALLGGGAYLAAKGLGGKQKTKYADVARWIRPKRGYSIDLRMPSNLSKMPQDLTNAPIKALVQRLFLVKVE